MNFEKLRSIHPFPARMAPEIAIHALEDLHAGDIILDPMAGSGTVLHQAALKGIRTLGFDLDPLSVLISTVITSKVSFEKLALLYKNIITDVNRTRLNQINLPWIDDDPETLNFIKYWFARKQINSLRKIAFALQKYKAFHKWIEIDVLQVALSRIIITKKIGASLAWDISHSRPHKMRVKNDYDVIEGYKTSVEKLTAYLRQQAITKSSNRIRLGDARNLRSVPTASVDKVITSPPYLNAIDYMRGNKFSLVWLGYTITQLRAIRSNSIGAERKMDHRSNQNEVQQIYSEIAATTELKSDHASMIRRYINDSILLMSEISRVLKKGRKATLVIGNSTLKGIYIENSAIFQNAGSLAGLSLVDVKIREIPISQRYLPMPKHNTSALGKRMKHEVIMTFLRS
jgi:DNA modification methylase